MSTDKSQLTASHGFSKCSHHWVKREGAVWLRLVKAGQASDPELEQKMKENAHARTTKTDPEKELGVSRKPKTAIKRPTVKTQRVARKIVDANRSELDDLESDAAEEHIRNLLDHTTTDAASTSESEEEVPTRHTGKSSRIRVKSAPIHIPDRRAALQKSLAQADSEDED